MVTEGIDTVIAEVREDFNIPPYFSDNSLKRFGEEGYAYLSSLNSTCTLTGSRKQDTTFKNLLKNYIYYAFNNAINDYISNYSQMILTWQAESECDASTTTATETTT